MALLIFALIILLVVAFIIWAIRSIPMPAPGQTIATVVVCLIGALVILNRAGLV